jgi:hypothetical protein
LSYKIPTDLSGSRELKAHDTCKDLTEIYNEVRKLINGRTISDVSLVWGELTKWQTVERTDLIIPYEFAHQRKEPMGHRVWYLSQNKGSRRYYGQFFDLKISNTAKNKIIRKACKLSSEAIRFFKEHPEVQKNEEINEDILSRP